MTLENSIVARILKKIIEVLYYSKLNFVSLKKIQTNRRLISRMKNRKLKRCIIDEVCSRGKGWDAILRINFVFSFTASKCNNPSHCLKGTTMAERRMEGRIEEDRQSWPTGVIITIIL